MMLIMTPTIFSKALEWQGTLAMTVPRIILGTTTTSTDLSTSDQGEELAATALKAFIQPNENCSDEQTTDLETDNVSTALGLVDLRCSSPAEQKQYRYQFNGFVSLIVGIALVILLASYSIDMGIRAIKLGILRLLAPIPIISYIDPKSEKSGSFSNWTKECASTYAELFIKLTVLYFVLYILSGITTGGGMFTTPEGLEGPMLGYVRLFLILAAFFFMGKASEFICNILGLKKPDNKGGWMKAITGFGVAGAMASGTLTGALTNYRGTLASQRERGATAHPILNRAAALGSAALGAGVGLAVSGTAAASAQRGKMGAALGAMYKRNSAYMDAASKGATLFGKVGAAAQRAVTGQTTADRISAQMKGYESYNKLAGQLKDRVSSEMVKSNDTLGEVYKNSGTYVNYRGINNAYNAAKSQGRSSFQYKAYDSAGNLKGTYTMTLEEAEDSLGYIKKTNEEDYLRMQITGQKRNRSTLADNEVDRMVATYLDATNAAGQNLDGITQLGVDGSGNVQGLGALKDNIDSANIQLTNLGRAHAQADANDSATRPK